MSPRGRYPGARRYRNSRAVPPCPGWVSPRGMPESPPLSTFPPRPSPSESIAAEQVAGVDLVGHVSQLLYHAVGEDHITLRLELGEIPDHPGAVELLFV